MRQAAFVALGLCCCSLLGACGEQSKGGPAVGSGQTGSPGASECFVASDCSAHADQLLAQLDAADPDAGAGATLRLARCEEGSCRIIVAQGAVCHVNDSFDSSRYDCGLSDDAILARYTKDHTYVAPPPCKHDGHDPSPCSEPSVPERYFPRDPREWQGMLISLNMQPPCERSAYCGLARACVDSLCTGCTKDAQCASGEVCVLNHCALSKLALCRSYTECNGSVCILSGYTGGTARGNEDMRAYCVGNGAATMP